jgi:hypothetical protein
MMIWMISWLLSNLMGVIDLGFRLTLRLHNRDNMKRFLLKEVGRKDEIVNAHSQFLVPLMFRTFQLQNPLGY